MFTIEVYQKNGSNDRLYVGITTVNGRSFKVVDTNQDNFMLSFNKARSKLTGTSLKAR